MAIELGSAYGRIDIDARGVHAGINEARGALGGFQSSMRNVMDFAIGGLVARGFTAIVGGATRVGGEVKSLATDFESQMAIMSTAVDPTVASLEDLHAAALTVGEDTRLVGIDASQAADAMTGLFKAGLSVNDVFGDMEGYLGGTAELSGALRASVDLQAASELNLAQASQAVAIAMKTFGMNAEEATGIADSFVGAADASTASVADLVDAMVNVGPTAAAFGWSLGDTNTALAVLSTRGIMGAEAGTALKSMMTNLMRPTDEVTTALGELGVALYDNEGHLKRLPDIVGELAGALGGMGDEQRNQYIQTLAGSYGMKAMNTLLAEGVTGWEGMEAAIAGASSASEVAEARMNTLQGAQEALAGVADTLKIRIGEALIPMWRGMAEMGSRLVEKYGPAIVGFFERVGKGAMGLMGVLERVVSGEFSLEALVPPAVMANVREFLDRLRPLGEMIRGDIMPAVSGFVPTLAAWGERLLTLASGVLPGVATGLVNLWTAGRVAWGWITETAIPTLREWGTAFVDYLQPYAAMAWGWITDTAIPALQTGWLWITETAIPTLREWGTAFVDYLQPYAATAWGWITDTAIPALQTGWLWITDTAIPKLQEWGAAFVEYLQPKAEGAWGWITDTAIPALQEAWGWITETAIPKLKEWGEAFETGFTPFTEGIMPGLREFSEDLRPKLEEALTALRGLWDKLGEVWGTVVTLWQESLKPAFEQLGEALGSSTGEGSSFAEMLGGIAGNTLIMGLEGLIKLITLAVEGLTVAVTAVTVVVEGFRVGIETIGAIIDGVRDGIGKLASGFEGLTGIDLPDWLTPGSATPFETALRGIAAAMREMPNLDTAIGRAVAPRGAGSITQDYRSSSSMAIYGGLTLQGVQDGAGLLEQLQRMAVA